MNESKCLISVFLVLTLLASLSTPVSNAEVRTGSLEVAAQFNNGDRVSPSEMVLKVYQDSIQNPFAVVEEPDNPHILSSLPLDHTYIVQVYVNGMYANTDMIFLKTSSKLTITVPTEGGFRVKVYYDDGNTPIKGALVTIQTHDAMQLRQSNTDEEGKTMRFWLQSTILDSDYYVATVTLGGSLVYEYPYIKLEPGMSKDVMVVTPWPSRVDELVVSVYRTPVEKASDSDGKITVQLHDYAGKKVSESVINRRGDVHFTNLYVGEYVLSVFRERENLLYALEDWGDQHLIVTSRQEMIKFVRNEPYVSSWQVDKQSLYSIQKIISLALTNHATDAKNVTVSLILDRDRMPPYDISKNVTTSIPAESMQNLQVDVTPNDKGLHYAYIAVRGEGYDTTDQVPWQSAFDISKLISLSNSKIDADPESESAQVGMDILQRVPRTCNCVAFRLDDIQDYFSREAQKDLIQIFVKEDSALTIGVIGGFLNADTELIDSLKSSVLSGKIEVANHSWNHKDHSAMTYDAQKDSIVKTNERIGELFGIEAETFIPPENSFNNDTLSIMREVGLTHLSGSAFVRADPPPYPLKNGDSIFHFPQTSFVNNVDTPTGKWTSFPNEQILETVRASVKQYGFAVVSLHPVAYYDKEGSDYIYHKERTEDLKTLLEEVKKEFKVVKISEIDEQGWIPKHLKQTVITDFQDTHGFVKYSKGGTQLDDTSDFVMGSASLKLTTDGDGQAVFTRKTGISPALDLTGKPLKIWVKVSDISEINELRVTVTSDNFASYKNYRIVGGGVSVKDIRNNEWNELTLVPIQSDESGVPDVSMVNTIQLRVVDKGNRPVSVWFNALAILGFDDTYSDMQVYDRVISGGRNSILSGGAGINIRTSEGRLLLDGPVDSSKEPFMMLIPEASMPQRPQLVIGEQPLPTMTWLDSSSKTWVMYVDPPRSIDSMHVVPEFDSALLILASTFGLFFIRIFNNKRSLHKLLSLL